MKNNENKSFIAYNKKADNYDNTFDGKFTLKFKQYLLEKVNLSVGDTVLDVACGNGTLLKMLSTKEGIVGKGIDISEKMIANAKRKAPEMDFEVAGCESIPFADKTVDIITVCASYHHFPAVNLFVNEANRLLKNKGVIYIAEIYLPSVLRHIANLFLPLSKEGDVKFYSPNEIVNTFEAYGFVKLDVFKKGIVQIVSLKRI